MIIADLFKIRVEEKIEPVIKVGEVGDEHKLASEIGSYVVTPLIEQHLEDFLELYTDTFRTNTTEVGVWISGYFGSGKSHLAKIMALLVGNRNLEGSTACERFKVRIPSDSPRYGSLIRSLDRMDQCDTQVLAFNLNTLADSKTRPLPEVLLSQYYISKGYSGNLIYARVIEAELDKQGKLADLHAAVEARAKKPWHDIQRNLAFYRVHLYAAACEVAPEVFPTPQDVDQALKDAQRGELCNVAFLIETIMTDINKLGGERKRPQRMMLVLDESGQWIENDAGRLAQLQALVEESAIKGQGKIWTIVTTHGDMGSIFKEARALEGDMKKIEGRFRFKPMLTTENIEKVLEDRLFKKTLPGEDELRKVYESRAGILRGIGELANTSQALPPCDREKFVVYYPFFPYQVHLIPEIVKSLRSRGGRGEQMTGSTRTLLAITQDILRAGRRPYLSEGIGPVVSFDEVYNNLVGEGEISPDVRTEISRIKDVVPGATALTPHVAEVLYLIRELPYIPRTKDNIARLLATDVDEDLPIILSRIEPELQRLMAAKMVAPIGEEYEFLTGERRTFEDAVSSVEAQYRQGEREQGLYKQFVFDAGRHNWRGWLGSNTVRYLGNDFTFRLEIDGAYVNGTQGDITLKLTTPLAVQSGIKLVDQENQSLRADEQNTLFFLCGRINGFDKDVTRFLAMKEVIDNWKGDAHRSEEARKLAQDRETNDLPKLERKVLEGLKEGIRTGHVIFRGSSRSLVVKYGETPGDTLRTELSTFWSQLYPKFEKVPVRIANDQRAIPDVLSGATNLTSDVIALKLYDKAGKVDPHSPLLDAIRMFLATEQNAGRRVLGKGMVDTFIAPPYGWDPNAVRVGIAALVRAGMVKVLINKKPYTNPQDTDLVNALRVSRNFDKVELVLEETDVDPDVLTETRSFLMQLAKRRGIDETPAALSQLAGEMTDDILTKAGSVSLWAEGAVFPLTAAFAEGENAWQDVKNLANPVHRVNKVHDSRDTLEAGYKAILAHDQFQQQHGKKFVEMRALCMDISNIGHLLPQNGLRSFIEGYLTANAGKTFTSPDVWKELNSLMAQAKVDLITLLDGWRTEAKTLLENAIARVPQELMSQNLDAALNDTLVAPLVKFRDEITTIESSAQVAALPTRAEGAIRQLGDAIRRALDEKTKAGTPSPDAGGGVEPPKPPMPREVRKLRPSDVVMVTRVQTVEQWEDMRNKLDTKVRALLNEGLDVELI